MIRTVRPEDTKEITDIYNHYVLNSIVTFEETPVSISMMEERMESVISKLPWLIYEHDQKIWGYAYATEWKIRSAYKHSVESTVYLKPDALQKGIGTLLYSELINQLRNLKMHAVMGGIALPNEASIALHEKLGFEKVAHFKEVGHKFERWIDVGYWQLIIE